MSAKLASLASDVKALGKAFRAVVLLADELERIGSIEQVEREATARKDKADKDATAAESEATAAQAKATKAKAAVGDAEAAAAQIIETAKAQARALRAEAAQSAKEKVATAEKDVAALEQQTVTARATLKSTQLQVGAVRGELADLEAKRDAMKKQFAALAK